MVTFCVTALWIQGSNCILFGKQKDQLQELRAPYPFHFSVLNLVNIYVLLYGD